MCLCARLLQSCLTLCDPMDCSPPGSSIHGILQARILEWVAMPFSRGSSWPRDQTQVFCITGGFFTIWVIREALDTIETGWRKREMASDSTPSYQQQDKDWQEDSFPLCNYVHWAPPKQGDFCALVFKSQMLWMLHAQFIIHFHISHCSEEMESLGFRYKK